MPIKITMIGAGSIGFTRRLIQDICTVPELQNAEFALTDISKAGSAPSSCHNVDRLTRCGVASGRTVSRNAQVYSPVLACKSGNSTGMLMSKD